MPNNEYFVKIAETAFVAINLFNSLPKPNCDVCYQIYPSLALTRQDNDVRVFLLHLEVRMTLR